MAIQMRDQSAEAILQRLDAIMGELEELRRIVLGTRSESAPANLVDQLYGVLGHGSWEEYDMRLDWRRFAS
jgi:hypothetical protein